MRGKNGMWEGGEEGAGEGALEEMDVEMVGRERDRRGMWEAGRKGAGA